MATKTTAPAAKKAPAKKAAAKKAAPRKPIDKAEKQRGSASRLKHPATGLTPNQEQFAALVAGGLAQVEAFRRAYPNSVNWAFRTINSEASKLATKPEVRARINELMEKAAAAHEVEVADVLGAYLRVAKADPRALMQHVRDCCRYCYGKGHNYQWTPAELAKAKENRLLNQAMSDGKGKIPDIDESGGMGYDPRKPPVEECPECHGRGIPRVMLADTRLLDQGASSLFAGVKAGKDGIEVKTHDQMAAWGQIARHLGFFEKDNEQQAGTFDVEALKAKYAGTMQRVADRQAAMQADRANRKKGG